MKRRFVFIILPLLVYSIGCDRVSDEYRSFLKMTPSDQHAFMSTLPLSPRVDFYLVGMRYGKPPQIVLAADIAREGKAALPTLTKRLQTEKDEQAQANLVLVFGVMHRRFLKLDNETDTLMVLRQTIAHMKNHDYRRRSEQTLRYIETSNLSDLETVLAEVIRD